MRISKQTYCFLASALLLLAGVGFGVAGFSVPPVGEVADSVLLLIAQCFVMAGSFVGLDAVLVGRLAQFKNHLKETKNEVDQHS